MSAQLKLITGFCKLLAYVFAFIAATFFLAQDSRAATNWTWTITIDVSKGVDPPAYSFKYSPTTPAPKCPGLPPMSAQKAEKLHICPGDKVEWEIRANGSLATLAIHQNRGFQPKGSDKWFRPASLTSANVLSDPNDTGNIYEYCVAVYDDQGFNEQLYSHDPKIIIGGTLVDAKIEEFRTAYSQVLTAIEEDSAASKEAKEKARKDAAEINEKIQGLLKLLNKK